LASTTRSGATLLPFGAERMLLFLWEVSFDAGVREAVLADVDGHGLLEIIVETDDG
jgi:hypothetical protein